MCLLLRRRHIVCVKSGESGRRRCSFHHRYRGSHQARSLGGAGGPRMGQRGAAASNASSRLPSGPSPSPAPPTTHTLAEAVAAHRGGPGLTPRAGSEAWWQRLIGWELALESPACCGGEGWAGAGTRGQVGGGGRQRGKRAGGVGPARGDAGGGCLGEWCPQCRLGWTLPRSRAAVVGAF